MAEKLVLHEDRFFDPDPVIRNIARELYEGVKDLPIVSPHGHVDPKIFTDNKPFSNPWNSQGFQRYSLRIQHSINIVIGFDKSFECDIFCFFSS